MKSNQTPRDLLADQEAVSPVVATLLLVLVAAGAAIGFGVFMNDFQGDTQENVSTETPKTVLRIGGSSTVFEFTRVVEPAFESAHPSIDIDLQSGGSGSGRDAVCLGAIDIGSSSSPTSEDNQKKCEALSGGQRMNVYKVATDGVVFATLDSNTHCASAISLTQDQAYEIYTYNADDVGGTFTGTLPAASLDTTDGAGTGAPDGDITWNEVPLLAGGFCTGSQIVEIFDRSDPGGTSEIAAEKLFGQKKSQLEDFGLTLDAANQGDGNQGVLDAVEDHPNADHALFFTSFGYANAQGLDVHAFGIDNTPIVPDGADIADEVYEATRPITYLTLGEPSAMEQLYLDFVMNSHRNQIFAEGADFESLY